MKKLRIAVFILIACAGLARTPAGAAPIPTLRQGSHLLVGIEPLLATLDLNYAVRGTHLIVGDRTYAQALVERGGGHYADAAALAAFLHLQMQRENGVLSLRALPQAPDPGAAGPPPSPALAELRARLIAELNAHRRAEGLAPLVADSIASQAAQMQAEDMLRSGVMRHLDSAGRSPLERFLWLGGRAPAYGENVGYYGLDVEATADQWTALCKLDEGMMAERGPEAGHRENILASRYAAVGIGIAIGPHGLYVAEDFVGFDAGQHPALGQVAASRR